MNTAKIAFVGGGKRMLSCAEALSRHGLECALFGFDEISDKTSCTRCASLYDCYINSSAIILPLPLSRDGMTLGGTNARILLCDVFGKAPVGVPIFAGNVSDKARAVAEESGREIYDYFDSEALTEKNAYATAEGAIYLAMQNSERTIFSSKCLVAGYGRIGRYTARLLKCLGADVTVMARREISRVKASLDGHKTVSCEELCRCIRSFDLVFNTVPENIFGEKEISKMSSHQRYIELASPPYGLDRRLCEKYNVEIVDGSALPSRYCPESAGEFIAEELFRELERSGVI